MKKTETMRRLTYGNLIKLFQHRYGHTLPDDDAGRADLRLLINNVSLAVAEPQKKMRHVIELWAPWMTTDERDAYVEFVSNLEIRERTISPSDLGKQVRLTNAERQRLRLWRIAPIDATKAELEEQRKARRQERRRTKLRAEGVKPRGAYLAEMASTPKPWIAAGVSRRTWYRRVARGHVPTIVPRTVPDVVPPSGQEAFSKVAVTLEQPRAALVPSSREQVTDLVPIRMGVVQMDKPSQVKDWSELDPLQTALANMALARSAAKPAPDDGSWDIAMQPEWYTDAWLSLETRKAA